jgi:hypothetical protein
MKSMSYSFYTVLVAASMIQSCGKKEDDSSGGSSQTNLPSAGLVAGDEFRNTAKSTNEVAAKFKSGCEALANPQMGGRSRGASCESKKTASSGDLTSSIASAFLTGRKFTAGSDSVDTVPQDGSPSIPSDDMKPSDLSLTTGSSCNKMIEGIKSSYNSAAKSLATVGQALVEFDAHSGELPEGMTKSGPTDQYAVIYSMDLAKMKSSSEENNSMASSQQQSGRVKDDTKVEGSLSIGAGSNDSMAVVGISADMKVFGQDTNVGLKSNMVTAVSIPEKLLKMSLDFGLAGRVPNKQETQDADSFTGLVSSSTSNLDLNINGNSYFTVKSGELPSVTIGALLNSNLTMNDDKKVVTTDKISTLKFKFTMAAKSKEAVNVAYEASFADKKASGTYDLETDRYGDCSVKSANTTQIAVNK